MTDENNVYLKPCPFCGDSGFSIFKEGSIYVVQCGSCLCKTGATTEKDVIEYWNGRPIEEALEEENKRLREVLSECCSEYKNDGIPRCYARRDDPDGHCAAAKQGCLIYKVLKGDKK